MLRRLILSCLLLITATLATGLWLATSESALQLLADWLVRSSAGRLQLSQPSGSLRGPLAIEQITWDSPDLKLKIGKLYVDWHPGALLAGKVAISELTAESLAVTTGNNSAPSPPPASLHLPVAVDIEKLAIFHFDYGASFSASAISGSLHSDGATHQLHNFRAQSGIISLAGEATLGATAPLLLNANARLIGHLQERPLALAIHASGPLSQIELKARSEKGITGQARATLTPFAGSPFASAHIELANINPAAWLASAPRADLALNLDLQPNGDDLTGKFLLTNRQPGMLDHQRLPLERLSGTLNSHAETLTAGQLQAAISGAGTLSGNARWEKKQLTLDLQASRLDAAKLVSSLRPTRLNGPLRATIDGEKQSLQTKLSDPRFTATAEITHAAGIVSVPSVALVAGDSRLTAAGELKLDKALAFRIEGELSRFDPSRFMKIPAALINSRFSGQGQLLPHPVFDATFDISDSRLLAQPLFGRGDFRLDWPHVPRAAIALTLGANHLQASGAYGQPGDLLEIHIDAPRLALPGLNGDLNARARLGGTPQAPTLSAQVSARQLSLPGGIRLDGLKLSTEAGATANAPIALELAIARLDTAEQSPAAKALHLQIDGKNNQHRLRGGGELAEQQRFAIQLEGGLNDGTWQGVMRQATFNSESRSLQLTRPAPLALAPDTWAIGPAEFNGDNGENRWTGQLQATADAQRLRLKLGAEGARLGQITAQLEAAMDGAWTINRQAPWQGSIRSQIADLGWFADVLGEQWKSGGSLGGELKITGTPAQPLLNGQFQGQQLVLRLAEQGLHLARGELDIELAANRLRVRKLSFDSLLQAPPRQLLRTERAPEIRALAGRPGRLEISGEMLVDRNNLGDNAFLDIRLDRLGAFQLPDQWVVVSGDGRLTWQDSTFGVRGKLAADAGYWQLSKAGSPRLSDDVVIKAAEGEKPVNKLRPKLDLDLSAELGKNFQFNGAGLRSRLVGDLRLRASGHDLPRASGSIRTRDGRFEAYGQQLTIERGILSFQGLLDNPALDVRAVRTGLAVEAGVQVSGTAQKPRVKLISDPDLPDPEKLAWLVLGHGPEQMSAGDATVLLSAAGSILGTDSGGVVQQLKKGFGIDELGVRSGQISDSGGRSQSSRVAGSNIDTTAATGNQILSVGKRLSSNAMLSYEQTLGKAESIVKLTVSLTRQISLIGRAGSDNAIDIFYILTLGEQRERRRRPSATTEIK